MAQQDQDIVAVARTCAQAFETAFDKDLPLPYIDLDHFGQILVEEGADDATVQAVNDLDRVLKKAVIAQKHDEDRPGATGISLYFPVFDLYDYYDNWGYTTVSAPFTSSSQWDEYLQFHFTNERPQEEAWNRRLFAILEDEWREQQAIDTQRKERI